MGNFTQDMTDEIARLNRQLAELSVMHTEALIKLETVKDELADSERHRDLLVEALQHYESPDNWEFDDVGIARVWLEPDSFSRKAYAGFELAMKALDGLKKENT